MIHRGNISPLVLLYLKIDSSYLKEIQDWCKEKIDTASQNEYINYYQKSCVKQREN